MVIRANWDDFNKKNKDKTKAFEDMCRVLFLRKNKKTSYDYSYNMNEAGLEFQPIYNEVDKKWYGAQCKYFTSGSSTSKYDQIYKSLCKAFSIYDGKLDVVYIYTNDELKPICTEKEINSKSKTPRVKIARESKEKNIEVKWIQSDNILDAIREESNLDLYKMYFLDLRENDFIKEGITIEENTFLQSNEFINLKFENGKTLEDVSSDILSSKFNLILGNAGTGKSIGMKYLYRKLLIQYNNYYKGELEWNENIYIPVFIKLRECTNGNLEELIRERFKDYGLNYVDKINSYFYLFDGLDEISYYDIGKITHYIKCLSEKNNIKGIIVSSRSNSNNLSYFRQEIFWNEYKFERLKPIDIKNYFKVKGNLNKQEKLGLLYELDIIKQIDDIFSVNLLWENIDRIDKNTSKIEIIELAVEHWANKSTKINILPLLNPKKEKIYFICEEVSYLMQKNMSLYTSIEDIQKLLKEKLNLISPNDINVVTETVVDLFFEYSGCSKYETIAFKHRRFQEFFLYKKLEREYYNTPNILRELKIFHDRDFVVNIFLKTSLKRARKNKDIEKYLSLKLLEGYLGDYYINDYKDEIIGFKRIIGYSEPSYSYSNSFLYLLSTYSITELDELFSNENLHIRDSINADNFIDFIEIYHKLNSKDILNFIKAKLDIDKVPVKSSNISKLCYYLYYIKGEGINEIYEKIKNKLELSHDDVKNMDIVAYNKPISKSFIELLLKSEINYLIDLIKDLDKYMIELICNIIIKYEYIDVLLSKNDDFIRFRKELINRIDNKDEDYYINTLSIYNLLTKKGKNKEVLDKSFDKINKRNFPTWSSNIELHILLAVLKEKEPIFSLREFSLGVKIVKVVYENYDDKNIILQKWIEIIKEYNYIYKDWLNYKHSSILGILISKLDFDIIQLKKFIRYLLKYDSVIYTQTVLFEIYKYNRGLLKNIVNKGLLDKILLDTLRDDIQEYDNISESIFQLATLYDSIDSSKKYELFIIGIENSTNRPLYKGDDLASTVIPYCLYLAYESYWYSEDELQYKCTQLYRIIEEIENSTENSNLMIYLKWLIESCNIDFEINDKLYSIDACSIYNEEKDIEYGNIKFDINNIKEYYKFEMDNIPYNSMKFWENIIDFEYKIDKDMSKLYEAFAEINRFTYFESKYNRYCHIPISILIEKNDTKERIMEFIMQYADIYSMFNMTQVYYLNGNMEEGKKFIDFMFKFCEMLVYKPILYNNKKTLLLEHNKINYNKEQWIIDEHKREAIFKENDKIIIAWNDFDDMDEFIEEWATNHPDKSAYRYEYKVYNDGKMIKRASLVWVDGYRALLPIPKFGTNIVKREEYLICRIFNHSTETLNQYMLMSRLIVD
ncbi:NACHT domain-containing protein [Paraclostridium sordellii]|uniref:NACHT domain-containing protein n=1 Tax=Paraclostridium sordellii TaxID=1505 RepID=UPI00096A4A36|nr:hypothetical protein [Paeniclostridium sordellii]